MRERRLLQAALIVQSLSKYSSPSLPGCAAAHLPETLLSPVDGNVAAEDINRGAQDGAIGLGQRESLLPHLFTLFELGQEIIELDVHKPPPPPHHSRNCDL